MGDLTELAVSAAATNDPRAVSALAASFSAASIHVPLETLEGVKNRPETVRELGTRLPVHRLKLDNGEVGIPLFTKASLCQQCADRLSWKTDGKPIKTLRVPGADALSYAKDVLVVPRIERVILNPLTDAVPLHLARTDIESMAAGRELRHLWFYAPGGRLMRPVAIEGSSLLDSILATADKALQRLADGGRLHLPGSESTDSEEIFAALPSDGPLRGLAAELYRLVSADGFVELELTIEKSGGRVEVGSSPPMEATLFDRVRAAAEKHLSSSSEDASLRFQFRGGSIVLSSSSSGSPAYGTERSRIPPPLPSLPSPPTRFGYIPLEPEAVEDDDGGE